MEEEHLVVEFRAPHNPHVTILENKGFNQAVNQLDHNVYKNVNTKEALQMLQTLNKALLLHLRLLGARLLAQKLQVAVPPVSDQVDAVLQDIADLFVYGPQAPHNIPPVAAAKLAQVQLFYNVQLRAITAFWKCVKHVVESIDVTDFVKFKTDLETACAAWKEEWKEPVENTYPEDIADAWRTAHPEGGTDGMKKLLSAAQRCGVLRAMQHEKEAKLFKRYFAKVVGCKEGIGQKAKEALRSLPPQALESLPREFQVVKLLNYVAHVRELLETLPIV